MRPMGATVNSDPTPVVVQKFGGTSVVTSEGRERVVDRILAARERGAKVVVVVSAMGRLGDPYATDTLLQLLGGDGGSAGGPQEPDAARERDLLLACGEIISTVVLAHQLRARGCSATALTGRDAGIVTDDNFGDATILRVETDTLSPRLHANDVIVVAGFQGATAEGHVTTLGRGGSDTTAAVLAAALRAEAVEFYKDVEGVFTADPKIVPEAKLLERVTYREIVEMAHLGARIVHPRAVEVAMYGNIPVRILPMKGDGEGTLVTGDASDERIGLQGGRPVTGVAHVPGRVQFVVTTEADFNEDGLGLRLFQALASARVSVDMIQVGAKRISFVVAASDKQMTSKSLDDVNMVYLSEEHMAKVSVAGAGMHGVPGVMARVMGALHRAQVRVSATTDSHVNISCLVREADALRAIRALHTEFDLAGDGTGEQEAAVHEVG